MRAVARHTDPNTSHEAAATVDLTESQRLVLKFARAYMGEYFTDKGLVTAYRRVVEHGETEFPALSDSRIRTARLELATRRLVFLAGYAEGTTRRERIWTLDEQLARAV